jgi:sulfonate transport system substrate-binding protein
MPEGCITIRLKLRALTLILVLFALPAVAGAETIRIGWLRAPNDLTLARAHGSLEKALAAQGVTVEWAGPFAAAAPAMEAMNAGAIDITAGSSTSSITALAAGVPMVVFAYQPMSPASEAILVPRTSNIRTLRDLEGHTVAVNRGGTGEYLLMRALDRNGVDPARVRRVYLSPSDSGPSFLAGRVDAWATWDPFVAIGIAAYGGRVLADGAAIQSENAVVLIASKAFASRHAGLLRSVFGVLQAENAWSLTHKAEAGAIWAQEMNIPASFGPALGANDAVPTTAVTAADETQISDIAAWYLSDKLVPRKPDIAAGVVQLR